MGFIKYGGMAMPADEAEKWGHRLDPLIPEREKAMREKYHNGRRVFDTSERVCTMRLQG